ncbi:MAG: sulfotransferase [Acidocella sp.]|nr:sulfotransferase [Acidocella sp.]
MNSEHYPAQPVSYRAIAMGLQAVGAALPRRLWPRHDPAQLMRVSQSCPSAGTVQGLVRLAASLDAESELTMFGALAIHHDFLRLLRNAAYIEAQHRDVPAIAKVRVTAPIFILGLPRSGTSFLHSLLALDAANQVPRNWQTIYPLPRPPDFKASAHKQARIVDRELRFFAGFAPGFSQAHPITADSPQECTEITAHTFQSLRFDTTFRVPSYQTWLDAHGHAEAFRFHSKFLQVLQHGIDQPRWVLKCPDHVFSIDAILQTYPDARFVIVHRDPLKVFASVANLTEILRRPFLKNIDPAEIGAQVTGRWIDGAKQLIMFDRRSDVSAARKIHIQYDDLIADPLRAVASIYALFNLHLADDFTTAIAAAMAANPRGGYSGSRRYMLGRFNIRPERLTPQFADYVDYFHVTP